MASSLQTIYRFDWYGTSHTPRGDTIGFNPAVKLEGNSGRRSQRRVSKTDSVQKTMFQWTMPMIDKPVIFRAIGHVLYAGYCGIMEVTGCRRSSKRPIESFAVAIRPILDYCLSFRIRLCRRNLMK